MCWVSCLNGSRSRISIRATIRHGKEVAPGQNGHAHSPQDAHAQATREVLLDKCFAGTHTYWGRLLTKCRRQRGPIYLLQEPRVQIFKPPIRRGTHWHRSTDRCPCVCVCVCVCVCGWACLLSCLQRSASPCDSNSNGNVAMTVDFPPPVYHVSRMPSWCPMGTGRWNDHFSHLRGMPDDQGVGATALSSTARRRCSRQSRPVLWEDSTGRCRRSVRVGTACSRRNASTSAANSWLRALLIANAASLLGSAIRSEGSSYQFRGGFSASQSGFSVGMRFSF